MESRRGHFKVIIIEIRMTIKVVHVVESGIERKSCEQIWNDDKINNENKKN